MSQFCVTYTNMLVSKNAKTPDAKPKRKSVEYRLCWVSNANFSRWPFALGTQRNRVLSFQWNMGFNVITIILCQEEQEKRLYSTSLCRRWQLRPTQVKHICNANDFTYILYRVLVKLRYILGTASGLCE